MVGVDVAPRDKGQIGRVEVELARNDAFAERLRGSEVAVEMPIANIVGQRQLGAAIDAVRVVEGAQDDRRAELAFVEQVVDKPVVQIDPGLEAREQDLRAADIEVMRPLGFRRVVQGRCRRRDAETAALPAEICANEACPGIRVLRRWSTSRRGCRRVLRPRGSAGSMPPAPRRRPRRPSPACGTPRPSGGRDASRNARPDTRAQS